MKLLPAALFACLTSVLGAAGGIWGLEDDREAYTGMVWEYALSDFGDGAYQAGVKVLFRSFEERTGKYLVPGSEGRVGIKIYTNSGRGLATPKPLVKAVIGELVNRGYERRQIFLLDVEEFHLRESGYIPPLSERERGELFEGVPVYILDSAAHFDPVWYYESPLPAQSQLASSAELFGTFVGESEPDDRKSFLAKPLLTDVDFWINIPMVTDHPTMGINGVLVNATLWNIGNRNRFFVSPANAPIAVAEIAAIPELASSWAMTLVPLERYQFIGGPVFNSLYTRSETLLWMSVNPVILDVLMLRRVNNDRLSMGFPAISDNLPLINYAESLGLGTRDINRIQWIRFP